MRKILSFLNKNKIRMPIAFAVGLVLMAIYNFSYQGRGENSWGNLEYYRDGSFIAGMVLLFIGLLVVISNFGAFDIFSFYPSRKRKDDGKKENYGEYVQRKNEQRSHFQFTFLAYFIVAFIYLIFSIICYFAIR